MQNFAMLPSTLDTMFAEGVALTLEARNYIGYHEQGVPKAKDLPHSLHAGYQQTRISARLIQAMTWLLAMKAVANGEITREQFSGPQYALGGGEECTDESGPDMAELPQGLRSLLDRSHKFYKRVERLDQMIRNADLVAEFPPMPAGQSGLRVISSN